MGALICGMAYWSLLVLLLGAKLGVRGWKSLGAVSGAVGKLLVYGADVAAWCWPW